MLASLCLTGIMLKRALGVNKGIQIYGGEGYLPLLASQLRSCDAQRPAVERCKGILPGPACLIGRHRVREVIQYSTGLLSRLKGMVPFWQLLTWPTRLKPVGPLG